MPQSSFAEDEPTVAPIAASSGTLSGTLLDVSGKPVADTTVELNDAAGKTVAQAQSDTAGQFGIRDIAAGDYTLIADLPGDAIATASVTISAGQESQAELTAGAVELDTVTVTARFERARNALSPSTGSSQFTFDTQAIENLPQGDNTPFNQVLLQAPGVANDSFGQIHVRGDHNDLQYRINGIILPEGTGGFGQVLDPRFAKSITLNTGALPAQYGLRTAGVVDIVTKDRLDSGDIDLYGGSHDTLNPSVQFGKTIGAFSAYVTAQYLTNELGVENPTDAHDTIHDTTRQGKGFGYFSYLLDDSTKLSAIVADTFTRLQIPNNPGQSPDAGFIGQLNAAGYDTAGIDSAGLDERQYERNVYGIVALQGVRDDGDLTYQLALYDRKSTVEFEPDVPGDLAFNGDASSVKRGSTTLGVQGDLSRPLGNSHTLSTGFSASTENDVADNTSQVFTTDGQGDVDGGPQTIVDNNRKHGNTLASVFVQDKWQLTQDLIVNYGLRYDHVDAFVKASQLSPRVGLVESLTPDTTLHAGYARYFTPPPNELVASSSLQKFANTTNAPAITTNSSVKPERSNYFDAGVTQQLTAHFNMGVDAYYRIARDILDEGQFGQALIFTPFNYDKGRIYGIELTSAYHDENLSAYLNFSRSSAQAKKVVSGEFNFDQADLDYIARHYVNLDHDQRVTISSGVSYRFLGTTFGVDETFGTGLRKDQLDPATGETLVPNGAEVGSNLQFDLSAARSLHLGESFGDLDLRLAALNVFDRRNEIRDGSGIGVGAPQYGPRAAVYFGVSKPFGT